MSLLIFHPAGRKKDPITGEKFDETDAIYRTVSELPKELRTATKFVFDEDTPETQGVFGDYDLDDARGHHTGCRLRVEGKNYNNVRKLYSIMGDPARAVPYQRARRAKVSADRDANRGAASKADNHPAEQRTAAAMAIKPAAARTERQETVHVMVTVNLIVSPGTSVEPLHAAIEPMNESKHNGHNGSVNGVLVVSPEALALTAPVLDDNRAAEPEPTGVAHGANGAAVNTLPRVGGPAVADAIAQVRRASRPAPPPVQEPARVVWSTGTQA